METPREVRIREFTSWCEQHIQGDEKGEAQPFLDRLFRAFGHAGAKDAGAVFEARVEKVGGQRGKDFADLVWKTVALFEMKKRGTNLAKHFDQLRRYWWALTPKTDYAILCNFDEFWIYDFDRQVEAPVDRVPLRELPRRWGALAFLAPEPERPVFGNDQIAVTAKAADRLADCFNKLVSPKRLGSPIERPTAQRFILQMLVALFAEDIGLLERYLVARLLDDCGSKRDSYDLLGGLFSAMNSPERPTGGRFAGVPYFNGGLFAEPARVELQVDEVSLLKAAATEDWSKVRPEIFGTLFEHSIEKPDRRAFGQHFTTPGDIMKIVKPTIIDPWRDAIESAKRLPELRSLWERMQHFTVLDPACGSGNFLCLAYRELKRLEARLLERMAEFARGPAADQAMFGFVTARQFHGLDINPFAVELAKVSLTIARKLAIDELSITEPALPLDNLDANIQTRDALIDDRGNPAVWPRTDIIIGNPPFLGAKLLKPQRGVDYVNAVRKAYPEVPGMADYCVYWFRKAHDLLPECTPADPLAGRAGLVGTQNVRNNQSRVGGLDHVVKTGTIIEAVDNQPWSGEANVHVSIVNWVKTHDPELLPSTRKLWTKAGTTPGIKKTRAKGSGPAAKDYELNVRECDRISASLSDQTDVSKAVVLRCNTEPQVCFNGQIPRCKGFEIEQEEANALLADDQRNHDVVFPFLIGSELLTSMKPRRWIIDFQKRSVLEARGYLAAYNLVEERVLPYVQGYADRERAETSKSTGQDQNWLQTWWQHFRCRDEMVARINVLSRYIACSDTTKRPVFVFIHPGIRPDHKLRVFAFDDDYSFGMLQSYAHWLWFITKCSKLTERFNYTSTSVFDPFPWPQSPTIAQIDAVAEAGQEVRRVRADALTKIKGGLRALYRTLELPGKNPLKDAHAALDRAVLDAYGFSSKKDLLAQLLALNLDVARREKAGEPVTAPGVPPDYPDPARLITADCIRAS